MKFQPLLLGILLTASGPLGAQTQQELATTCLTLARLTDQALQQNQQYRVVLYVQTTKEIRAKVGDANACQATYFASVVSSNLASFANVTTVIALNFVQPVPGWKHHEIQELLRASGRRDLSEILEEIELDGGRKIDLNPKFDINQQRPNIRPPK